MRSVTTDQEGNLWVGTWGAGIAKMIMKLADDDVRFNLAISLHTASNSKRDILMPLNQKIKLEDIKADSKFPVFSSSKVVASLNLD